MLLSVVVYVRLGFQLQGASVADNNLHGEVRKGLSHRVGLPERTSHIPLFGCPSVFEGLLL